MLVKEGLAISQRTYIGWCENWIIFITVTCCTSSKLKPTHFVVDG